MPSVPAYFRMLFNEFLDNVMQIIRFRMDQPAVEFYCTAEDAILSAANRQLSASDLDGHLTTICEHFKDDLDRSSLHTNFVMLPDLLEGHVARTLGDITDGLLALGPAMRLYRELVKLVVLMLVIPATSATAERSFSATRRLKTYLRTTIGQERLNSIMLLNIHENHTDVANLSDVARDFVALNEHRRNVFGDF